MNKLIFCGLLGLLTYAVPASWAAKATTTDTSVDVSRTALRMPDFVTAITDDDGFSATLCEDDLRALHMIGVQVVVRLNGDDPRREVGCISTKQEHRACKQNYLIFQDINIEGDIRAAAEKISMLMDQYSVVVHCRNGAHRAPAMAAYHLAKLGVPRKTIIERVKWQELVQQPGRYARYIDAVLPL